MIAGPLQRPGIQFAPQVQAAPETGSKFSDPCGTPTLPGRSAHIPSDLRPSASP
jgi:hypothetical protein